MSYRKISNFASGINNISNDTDTMDSQFLHGSTGRTFGKNNRNCAIYMSNRCAEKWDNICEIMSECKDICGSREDCCGPTSAGDILVRDTAYMKYLLNANGSNVQCEPFDPTVADSPSICYINHSAATIGDTHATMAGVWYNGVVKYVPCAQDASFYREYGLTDAQIRNIDRDPVMCKLIDRPNIAPELLKGMYFSIKKHGMLMRLKGTRLGDFYNMHGYPV